MEKAARALSRRRQRVSYVDAGDAVRFERSDHVLLWCVDQAAAATARSSAG